MARVGGPATRPDRVIQGGRAKAYRPLPADARRAALVAGLEAYRQGDFFEAHELLEPAWMGTADPVERDLYQGLIKLAAGYVHAVRGNPAGLVANLRGARERLASAAATDPRAGGLDLRALIAAIDDRLAGSAGRALGAGPAAMDAAPRARGTRRPAAQPADDAPVLRLAAR